MSETWKTVNIFLPSDMPTEEVRTALREAIICTATDSGEFVRRYRIGDGVDHLADWRKWTASYLPGPPGVLHY
jgi:hypothetical protein